MTDHGDILKQGFEQVRLELAEIVGAANLHLKPDTLGRGLAARTRARLKALEVILRRLILLLAATLSLAPAKPRTPPAAAPCPEGVEDVTASFGVRAKRRTIPLFGPAGRAPPAAQEGKGVRLTGDVPAAGLLAHAAALYRVLKDPNIMARRMARKLDQMRARGEMRPVCLPQAGRHRMRAELGLLSGLLPDLIRTVLAPWPDTS